MKQENSVRFQCVLEEDAYHYRTNREMSCANGTQEDKKHEKTKYNMELSMEDFALDFRNILSSNALSSFNSIKEISETNVLSLLLTANPKIRQ